MWLYPFLCVPLASSFEGIKSDAEKKEIVSYLFQIT